MKWVPISESYPPADGSLIYEYDGIYEPFINYANTTRQHIIWDINNLRYSRVKFWGYKKNMEDSEGNLIEPLPETGSKSEKETQKKPESNTGNSEASGNGNSWRSKNGKWTVESKNDLTGSLFDNSSGKVYSWEYKDGRIEIGLSKLPKYIENKIKELVNVD